MKKKTLVNMGAAIAMGIASFGAAPASARHHYDRGDYYRGGDGYRGYRGYRGDYAYRDGGYRGYRGGYRCRDSGTGGAILGAIAGGLIGRSVDTRGERATGTLLGAGAGALIGQSIDKSDGRRC
jgi:hypothetical protein